MIKPESRNMITVRCEGCNTVHTLWPDQIENPFFCNDFERCVEAKKQYKAENGAPVSNDISDYDNTPPNVPTEPVEPVTDNEDGEEDETEEDEDDGEDDDRPASETTSQNI